ncbi:MAG: Crp/Fnr family transcriptional regulator [Chloroflexota bacterium]
MQYQFPIFENLCLGWETIAHLGSKRIFLKGSQIFDIINPINGIYYVKKGSVEIILNTQNGPEKVLFYVGAGCIFGEVSCFVAGDSGEAHVRARSDCECYYFNRATIEGIIANQYPKLLIELIRAEAYKIRMYGVLLQDSLNNDNFIRVCKMLIYLAHFKDTKIDNEQMEVILIPDLTQNDIARMMGVHRVTVTKAIGKLKKMGIIVHFSKKNLEISNFPELNKLVKLETN